DMRWTIPGRPRQWSPWKWLMQILVIARLGTPASSICRWAPSPGSNNSPSPSQRSRYPLWLRDRVGAWLAVPSTTSSRAVTATPHAGVAAGTGCCGGRRVRGPRSSVLDGLGAVARRARLYRAAHGRWPAVLRPRSFTEKLNWRISWDRRPLLAHTCDKLAMKEHACRAAAGLVRVPETFWSGTDVADLVHADLPPRWVLKPNHTCMRVHFGEGRPDPG